MSNDRHLQSRRAFACSTAATAMAALGAIPDRSPAAEPQAPRAEVQDPDRDEDQPGLDAEPGRRRPAVPQADRRGRPGHRARHGEGLSGNRHDHPAGPPRADGPFRGGRIADRAGERARRLHPERPPRPSRGPTEIDNLKRIGEMPGRGRDPRLRHPGLPGVAARRRRPRRLVSQEQGRGGYGYPAFDLAASEASRAEAQIPRHGRPALEGAAQHLPASRPVGGGEQDADRHARQRPAAVRVPGQPADPLPFRRLRSPVHRGPEQAQRHDVLRRDALRVGRGRLRGDPAIRIARASCFTSTSATSAARCRSPAATRKSSWTTATWTWPRCSGPSTKSATTASSTTITRSASRATSPLPKQYIAFAVGYMRGLIQSLGG